MTRGPAGRDRFIDIGPYTYDPKSPPECPSGFEPPDDIMNAKGDSKWYTNWEDKSIEQYGLTGLYDINNDRMICDNRMMGYEGGEVSYTHDDMVVDMVEKSHLGRVPSPVLASEAGGIMIDGSITISAEIPTAAGGAWVIAERLGQDVDILKDEPDITVELLYKHIFVLAKLDMPEHTVVRAKHNLGPFQGDIMVAERAFDLGDAYRELQFENQLPEPVVSPV